MESPSSTPISGSDPVMLREAVARAVDFRGDVTIETLDGASISGYAFDAVLSPADRACVRVLPADSSTRVSVPLSSIRTLAFTGKDAASGRSWENWLRRYAEQKLAGQAASIESEAL